MERAKDYVAPRTCAVIEGELNTGSDPSSKPLRYYADAAAYVLIAEPGAGKTTAFKTEAARQRGEYETVTNFRAFDDKAEWHDKTMFLDGLDESRAGALDGRTPLDEIRGKLHRLGCPPFRLSCRWADWMAVTDRNRLREVSRDGTVIVLRLDPLSEQNVKDILANNYGVEDTDGFIETARERGVEQLLSNPQNLELLARSVSRGKWPDSRKETFDEACRILACEPNGEHLAANPSSADTGPLIEAAGRLCATQLLSGVAGYTLPDRAEPDDTYPSLTEVGDEARGRMRQVLGTRLFVGASEGKLAPAHRQIAEFLAAQHVSRLLDEGLPLERVLALVTGFDGELVPSFGNFVSWLAVHNKRSRKRLSQLDPSGLIYAGDQQTYSISEKREILRSLRRQSWNPWCSRSLSWISGIGAIVSPELEETFREILSEGQRDNEHQSYVMSLMQMLADGEPLPALSDALQEAVRDPTWNYGVRCAAVDVLAAYHADDRLGTEVLTRIVASIEEGSLDDPQDELLGITLKALYPAELSMAEVQRYLREPKRTSAGGEYANFWKRHVPNESTPEQVTELLDGIATRFEDYRPFLTGETGRRTGLSQLPLDLLTRILTASRWGDLDGVAADRLYEWLGVVSDPGLAPLEREKTRLRFDLEWNADALKAVIAHGVETRLRAGGDCSDLIDRHLFGARPRLGYDRWCVEMALNARESEAASFYLLELVDRVTAETTALDELTVEGVRLALTADEALVEQFDEIVERRTRGETRRELRAMSESAANPELPGDTAEQLAWQARIVAEAMALRVGLGSPQLLYQAAEVYLGIQDTSVGKSPRQRVVNLIGSRDDLIDLLVSGLEGSVEREDLPECDDVVRLFDRSRVHWLVLPFVAGLHSLEQSDRLVVEDLSEGQIRLAVTLLYMLPQESLDPDSTGGTRGHRPVWFRNLLRDNPALVANTIRRSAARKLETGVQSVTELRELGEAADHEQVAEIASLPILESFPRAETESALMGLCWSLKAALVRCEWSALGHVIRERLARASQGSAEQACWVTAGYLVDPARFREDFQSLAEDEEGLQWLPRFVAAGSFRSDFGRRLTSADVASFVVAMGVALRIHGMPERAYWSTADLIAALAEDPGRDATDTLAALARVADAKPWTPAITDATDRQARKRREREYRHADIRQVVKTLDNGTPANAADLAALVVEELQELSLKIRDGNTSDWRQHWNTDHHKRPTNPKHEDLCRDAVLSDLQDRLGRLGIDAQPEGVYAEDKRADIRVSFDGLNVPVEIKRSCHDDLWTAVHNQLIAKYTRDPGASGSGIYLVFWFGDTEKCAPTRYSAWAPQTAEDVRRRILESLDQREQRLISVCVIDVAPPQ